MGFSVAIPQPVAEKGIQRLKEAGAEVIIPDAVSEELSVSTIRNCDAVLIRTMELSSQIIEQAPRLKIIARHGVGLDNIDVNTALKKGVYVTNVPRANINAVAEHVMGMMIAGARQFIQADQGLRKGHFSIRNQILGIELKGKTLGIVGFGNIGHLIAEKAYYGLGMKVNVYDPYLDARNIPAFVHKTEDQREIFKNADIVTLHVPYLSSTHHLVNENAFSMMKDSAILLNAARGEIVKEKALIQALKEKEIRGACLDVFEKEPPGKDHPLWELDNVFVTPHMAALTEEAMENMAVTCADAIINVMNGEEPENVVKNG
ncbi:hydroxyacid dehydrogenase [Salibacterium aidingense]|uniref:hydroxyacid dehydrogenase n=1 Tax=Salibacterium aidingense TaxID=384933 RepID=UPI0004077C21|nr:hydroxyacid dehydrogenase [Salibacterium aidingense]